jgi:hypothetical protein
MKHQQKVKIRIMVFSTQHNVSYNKIENEIKLNIW